MPYFLTRGAYDEHTEARLERMRPGHAGLPLLHTHLTCGACAHFERKGEFYSPCAAAREQLRKEPEAITRRTTICAWFTISKGD